MRALEKAVMPWTGQPCLRLPDARGEIARRCGGASADLLPERIEVLFDEASGPADIQSFLESVCAQLARETSIWRQRVDALVADGLIEKKYFTEAARILRGAQTWYVCSSAAGGLTAGTPLPGAGDPDREQRGVIPCSAATHHGVAWWPADRGRGVGLVTSRRVDGNWNWDEDIGHEAAHASFGPVPLYSQTLESEGFKTRLADAYEASNGELTEVLVARVTYLVSELVVAFVRGEQRMTGTGLPGLHSAEDFRAFCTLAHKLMPQAQFDKALRSGEAEGMPLAVWSGPTIRLLGAAAFRAAPAAIPLINETRPPAPHKLALAEVAA